MDPASLLAQLNQREPQLASHPAVAELLGLPDACLAPENAGAEHYEPLNDRFADIIDGLDRLRLLAAEHGPLGV